MKQRVKWLMVALALSGVAGGVYAQTASSSGGPATSATTPGGGHWHHRGGTGAFMLHALHQLNLSDAQQQSIHTILAAARSQAKAERQSAGPVNFAALANPGDPNHSAAVQEMQTRMTARLQAQEALTQQIYAVLTADQKSQLTALIAARQAKWAQRSAS